MFQDGQLFAHRTVGGNVAYGLPARVRRARRGAARARRPGRLRGPRHRDPVRRRAPARRPGPRARPGTAAAAARRAPVRPRPRPARAPRRRPARRPRRHRHHRRVRHPRPGRGLRRRRPRRRHGRRPAPAGRRARRPLGPAGIPRGRVVPRLRGVRAAGQPRRGTPARRPRRPAVARRRSRSPRARSSSGAPASPRAPCAGSRRDEAGPRCGSTSTGSAWSPRSGRSAAGGRRGTSWSSAWSRTRSRSSTPDRGLSRSAGRATVGASEWVASTEVMAMTLELREVVSVDIPVPLAKVWAYLREPALVRRWYGWDHDGLDAEVRAFVDTAVETQDVVGDATIHTLTWPHHDRLTLRSAAHEPRHTRLTVTRRSHEGMATFDGVRDEVDEGWIAFAHQLQFALTVHPDQDRRTLSMFGLPPATAPTGCSTAPGSSASAACPSAVTSRRAGPTARCSAGRSSTRRRSSSVCGCTGSPRCSSSSWRRPPRTPRRTAPSTRSCPPTGSTTRRSRRSSERWSRLVADGGRRTARSARPRQLSLSCHSPEPPAGRNPSATLMASM